MWGLGCVFAELLATTSPYHVVEDEKPKHNILFVGRSCYPLSPCSEFNESDKSSNLISEDDQMMKIFSQMGHADEDSTSFLTYSAAQKYIQSIKDSVKQKDLAERFSLSRKESVRILKSLLELNPYLRTTAANLMTSASFDSIRVPDVELTLDKPIKLPCDEMNAYDYSQEKDMYFPNMASLRKAIIKEIKKVKA